MIQRILTASVLIPLVLLLILRAPIWLLAIVAGIVALLAIREFLELTRHYGVEPFTLTTYTFVGIYFVWLAICAGHDKPLRTSAFMVLSGLFAALAPFVFLTIGMKRRELRSVYPAVAASVAAFAYIAIPMSMLVDLRQWSAGGFTLLYLMLVVWLGDIFAYFVGKSIGRHRMAPRVSPGKTWEGAAASVLSSVGVGIVFAVYSAPISDFLFNHDLLTQYRSVLNLQYGSPRFMITLSVVLNIAAQLGDLVESAIKRGADVKDSGVILPGHGGMLDRIDALLFAAVVLWFADAGNAFLNFL